MNDQEWFNRFMEAMTSPINVLPPYVEMDIEEALNQYCDSIGKIPQNLTIEEKREAILNHLARKAIEQDYRF